MKFEHVLQIYWTKGFFFGGTLFYTNQTMTSLLDQTPGLSSKFRNLLHQRFELTSLVKTDLLPSYEATSFKIIIKPLNIILSQIHTVNNKYHDIHSMIIMRLYLTRTYRGKCHAIGKPVRGQRTWSNAWTSYKYNKILRTFLAEIKRKSQKSNEVEKINYKVIKKKYPSSQKNKPKVDTKRRSKWF